MGGAPPVDYGAGNYQAGYASQGSSGYASPGHPEASYWNAGVDAYSAQQEQMAMLMAMMSPHEAKTPHEPSGSSYQSSYQAQLDAQLRQQGIMDMEDMYAQYMDAAGAATDYINTMVADEMANAALLGVDYNITQEQKDERISNYFGTIWGEGSQARLETLMDQWGSPQGFEGFTITRGEGVADAAPGDTEQIGQSGGMKPRARGTLAGAEEETLAGKGAATLGV